jgi:spermidine/putrescine transport system ATP-binding protein
MMKQVSETSRTGEADQVLLRLARLSKVYGETTAVAPLDLEIHRGDFFAILGPSGCGKTTLLRMIGGFIRPTMGDIFIDGRRVTDLGPEKRPTNMVFQGYGLFPHMTVRQNIAYGLRIRKTPERDIEARLADVIALVRLHELGDRSVAELSGGQQQRVALARALVMRPPVLLLDEPLAALDLKLRQAMQEELRRIHHQIGGTFVFVTHDQGEAMSLANRVAVMNEGKLLQVGSPEDIYRYPRSTFVATFIGEANVLPGVRQNGTVTLAAGPIFQSSGADSQVVAIVRPEAMSFASHAANDDWRSAAGRIVERIFLGSLVRYQVDLDEGEKISVQISSDLARPDLAPGAHVIVAWPVEKQSILEA